MVKLRTRVDHDLLVEVDGLVADGTVASRSEAVRLGLRGLIDAHRRRQDGDAIVAGYRARPQTASELGWADDATVAMIGVDPW